MTQAMTTGATGHTADPANDIVQFVTFDLGEQRYGIDIMTVREIRISNTITALPGAPAHVRGVINLRGTIVPVCDLKRRFGYTNEDTPQNAAIVIASLNGKLTGLLVDEVCDILSVPRSKIAPIPETGEMRHSPFFHGLVTEGEKLLIVLAPERLMSALADAAETPCVPPAEARPPA